jgi:glycine hydroxymethyltransferase
MAEGEMKEVAGLIARAVRDSSGAAAGEIADSVRSLVGRHPAYPRP